MFPKAKKTFSSKVRTSASASISNKKTMKFRPSPPNPPVSPIASNAGSTCQAGVTGQRSPKAKMSTYIKDIGFVPTVLVNAATILESHMMTKDLFQTQGSTENVSQLTTFLKKRASLPDSVSISDVTEVIKAQLSKVIPKIIPDTIMTKLRDKQDGGQFVDVSGVITEYREMAPDVAPSLHFILRLLNKIAKFSEFNGMDVRKLATVFVLDVLKPLSADDPNKEKDSYSENRLQRVKTLPYDIMVVEHLIRNLQLFEGRSSPPKSFRKCADDQLYIANKRDDSIPKKEQGEFSRSPAKVASSKISTPPTTDQKPKEEATGSYASRYATRRNPVRSFVKPAQRGGKKARSFRLSPRHTSQPRPSPKTKKIKKGNATTSGHAASNDKDVPGIGKFKKKVRKKGQKKGAQNGDPSGESPEFFDNGEVLQPWAGTVSDSEDLSLMFRSTYHPQTFKFIDEYHMTLQPDGIISRVDMNTSMQHTPLSIRESPSGKRQEGNPRMRRGRKKKKTIPNTGTQVTKGRSEASCERGCSRDLERQQQEGGLTFKQKPNGQTRNKPATTSKGNWTRRQSTKNPSNIIASIVQQARGGSKSEEQTPAKIRLTTSECSNRFNELNMLPNYVRRPTKEEFVNRKKNQWKRQLNFPNHPTPRAHAMSERFYVIVISTVIVFCTLLATDGVNLLQSIFNVIINIINLLFSTFFT